MKISGISELRCSSCHRMVGKNVMEDGCITIEIKCPKCGKVSRYIVFKLDED